MLAAIFTAFLAATSSLQANVSLQADGSAETDQLYPQMLLIGGGLKICSSFSQSSCKRPLSRSALKDKTIRSSYDVIINKATVERIQKDPYSLFKGKDELQLLLNYLNRYRQTYGDDKVTREQFDRRVEKLSEDDSSRSFQYILDSFDFSQRQFIQQNLQAPIEWQSGEALREHVYLNNSDEDSVTIIRKAQQFSLDIAKSKKKSKSRILVLTSSSSDPFDAVSFYLNLFSSEQVEAVWLPLEPALYEVTSSDNLSCDDIDKVRAKKYQQYERKRVYPLLSEYQRKFCENRKLIDELILTADALFINGGDQTLTLKSIINDTAASRQYSPYFELIKQQFESGNLLIMGTSAGTAVQSGSGKLKPTIPMISNGESLMGGYTGAIATFTPPAANCDEEQSCPDGLLPNSLTYNPRGGLGLISLGVFDTHFSERQRLARLSRLLLDTKAITGIGIDENTALHIKNVKGQNQFDTYGEGASWFIDASQASLIKNKSNIAMNNLSISVLREAGKSNWSEQEIIEIAFSGIECQNGIKLDCQLIAGESTHPLVLVVQASEYQFIDGTPSMNLTVELSILQ